MKSTDRTKSTQEQLAAMEAIEAVLDMVSGYRSKCLAAGFGEAESQAMAVQFHGYVIASLTEQSTTKTKD